MSLRIAAIVLVALNLAVGQNTESFEVPAIYRSTREQAGHEWVKTEQFIVPIGATVQIAGLTFPTGKATLTEHQKLIIQQIFNSLEEVTENTVGDPDEARVARFKKMEFEIRGYSDSPGDTLALAEERAKIVRDTLTNLGTPPWRLKIKGLPAIPASAAPKETETTGSCVVFVRLK